MPADSTASMRQWSTASATAVALTLVSVTGALKLREQSAGLRASSREADAQNAGVCNQYGH